MRRTPEIDPSSIGVSFVDILFALAVGQVFAPVAEWAQDPAKHPLAFASFSHLVVALTMTITSWIGYHASANKPRFKPHFFNVELVKLTLDITMVAVYFVLAANAVRIPVESRHETVLVFIAFSLYFVWDLASAYQKRVALDNVYRKEWEKVRADKHRIDVTTAWVPTNWGRVGATFVALLASMLLARVTWTYSGPSTASRTIATDVALLVILIGYRMLKELGASTPPTS